MPERRGPADSAGAPNFSTGADSVRERHRQLAAVMFADIVGYTALMQEDEQLGIETRAKYLNVLEAQHEAFGGRVVQYYGDGALTMFPNSVDAVRCAIEMAVEPPIE